MPNGGCDEDLAHFLREGSQAIGEEGVLMPDRGEEIYYRWWLAGFKYYSPNSVVNKYLARSRCWFHMLLVFHGFCPWFFTSNQGRYIFKWVGSITNEFTIFFSKAHDGNR